MIRDFKIVREKMNELLRNIDTTSESINAIGESVLNSIRSSFKPIGKDPKTEGIYAWVPLITAFCPRELGTTSDQCSSSCGVGRCSGRSPGEQDVEDTPAPVPVMGRMAFNSWAAMSLESSNPF